MPASGKTPVQIVPADGKDRPTDNLRCEIGQPDPVAPVIPSPDEQMLSGIRSGSLVRRSLFVLLAIVVLAGPLFAHYTQEKNRTRMAEEQAAAGARAEIVLVANRVAGQFARAVALLETTAGDIENFHGGREDAAMLVDKVRGESMAVIAFFDSADKQAKALTGGETEAMPLHIYQQVFMDGGRDIIAFYNGASRRLETRLNRDGSPAKPPSSGEMTSALNNLQQRETALTAWLREFHLAERR